MMIVVLIALIFIAALTFLELKGKIKLLTGFTSPILIFIYSKLAFITDLYFKKGLGKGLYAVLMLWLFYLFIKLSVAPTGLRGKNIRLAVLSGGRRLIKAAWISVALQVVFYIVLFASGIGSGINKVNLYSDMLTGAVVVLCFFYNGCIRVVFASKWLGVIKRIAAFWLLPVPVVNIFITCYLCRTAYYEYDYECYNINDKKINYKGDMCKTKYPILMIHGVGFRDFRYFNYWGRIPKELKSLGAEIYYGNQEAFGTVEYNAEDIKDKIMYILKETGAEKVNIIAHSKGGLDARYAVSMLGMDKYVASLTTVSTPHRGVLMVDYLCRLPDFIYRAAAGFFDFYFGRLGDIHPDFYNATRAFSTEHSREFNDKVKDCDNVYYQSYTSVLKGVLSDYILCLPFLVIKRLEGPNDGLVSVESAKWGEFKGVITSKYRRGISHGDIIDLKREDYRGFDVVKWYVGVVSELKDKGF